MRKVLVISTASPVREKFNGDTWLKGGDGQNIKLY